MQVVLSCSAARQPYIWGTTCERGSNILAASAKNVAGSLAFLVLGDSPGP